MDQYREKKIGILVPKENKVTLNATAAMLFLWGIAAAELVMINPKLGVKVQQKFCPFGEDWDFNLVDSKEDCPREEYDYSKGRQPRDHMTDAIVRQQAADRGGSTRSWPEDDGSDLVWWMINR